MNMAKADYITAQTNTTKAVNSVNSTLTALRISLQRALDTKNSVLTIDDSVAKALSDASDAIALLNTLEGVSEIIKTAAAEAFSRAQEAAVEVNAYVEAANTKYNEAAELVKDYVVIEEKPADDTPQTRHRRRLTPYRVRPKAMNMFIPSIPTTTATLLW